MAAQPRGLEQYDVVWNRQSQNSGQSMPCGGGDLGMNVWVEKGDILVYLSRGGTFDEHNTMLKLGRLRLRLSPNPLAGSEFRQELKLSEGQIHIYGRDGSVAARITIWADVFRPAMHVDVNADKALSVQASYESWRTEDRISKGRENNANSWKWAPPEPVLNRRDKIGFRGNAVLFYHRNQGQTAFDIVVKQQGMDALKSELYNPLDRLTFGGMLSGPNMQASGEGEGKYMDTPYRSWSISSIRPVKRQRVDMVFYTAKAEDEQRWIDSLQVLRQAALGNVEAAHKRSLHWWKKFWDRSYVFISDGRTDTSSRVWQAGRNYQLFRYMLACNAYGEWPTKFNGGLFTYDPAAVDSSMRYTPDFRNWGGGTHTAQNQRLVYWPMLKSGDFDMMKPQFKFYQRIQHNAELRSKFYWNHGGGCFTEQIENFGFPNPAEYNWKRPESADKGIEYNKWLEYEWDTVLEFCLMMLDQHRYAGADVHEYIPFVESCLHFFDQHYQREAIIRGGKPFDAGGKLIIYPGSGAETYKIARNPSSTIAALKALSDALLALPDTYLNDKSRAFWRGFSQRIPAIAFREQAGKSCIAPAWHWERINNTEVPQLYPVFPWGLYGVGLPDLDKARNTYLYDEDALKFRSYVGWKQDNIFAARLGMPDEAAKYTLLKLADSGRRFPAFWGPGFDWTPDHNWGGSGMIGLQEMLMQTVGDSIYLMPAMPADWNVRFRLHAPKNTRVDVEYKNGKLRKMQVFPASRRKDVILMKGRLSQKAVSSR